MYFAIIWNNLQIALRELELITPTNIQQINAHIITFDTEKPKIISSLASLVKWWKIISKDQLSTIFSNARDNGKRLLWMEDTSTGITRKKKYGLKRFKKVDILHTDREVKEKWIEIITLPKTNGLIWLVQWYQNIRLYEVIDFDKPARSMQVWMMPAKLTHSLINIWLSVSPSNSLIFDPFCWTGTTGFLSNYFWLNFIWSDIKIQLADTNAQWRKNSNFCVPDHIFSFFTADISTPLDSTLFAPLLSPYTQSIIITEWRLWPIIKQDTTLDQTLEYQRRVKNLYLQFINTIADFFKDWKQPLPPMVFTIPIYNNLSPDQLTIEKEISQLATKLWRNIDSISEPYQRDGQKVARKILILK